MGRSKTVAGQSWSLGAAEEHLLPRFFKCSASSPPACWFEPVVLRSAVTVHAPAGPQGGEVILHEVGESSVSWCVFFVCFCFFKKCFLSLDFKHLHVHYRKCERCVFLVQLLVGVSAVQAGRCTDGMVLSFGVCKQRHLGRNSKASVLLGHLKTVLKSSVLMISIQYKVIFPTKNQLTTKASRSA